MTHDNRSHIIPIIDPPDPPEPLRDGGHRYRYYGDGEVACTMCGHAPWMRPYPCPVTTTARYRKLTEQVTS